MPRIKPGMAGWDVQMLSLCYSVPPDERYLHVYSICLGCVRLIWISCDEYLKNSSQSKSCNERGNFESISFIHFLFELKFCFMNPDWHRRWFLKQWRRKKNLGALVLHFSFDNWEIKGTLPGTRTHTGRHACLQNNTHTHPYSHTCTNTRSLSLSPLSFSLTLDLMSHDICTELSFSAFDENFRLGNQTRSFDDPRWNSPHLWSSNVLRVVMVLVLLVVVVVLVLLALVV